MNENKLKEKMRVRLADLFKAYGLNPDGTRKDNKDIDQEGLEEKIKIRLKDLLWAYGYNSDGTCI